MNSMDVDKIEAKVRSDVIKDIQKLSLKE